jgi:hypothetical protein
MRTCRAWSQRTTPPLTYELCEGKPGAEKRIAPVPALLPRRDLPLKDGGHPGGDHVLAIAAPGAMRSLHSALLPPPFGADAAQSEEARWSTQMMPPRFPSSKAGEF